MPGPRPPSGCRRGLPGQASRPGRGPRLKRGWDVLLGRPPCCPGASACAGHAGRPAPEGLATGSGARAAGSPARGHRVQAEARARAAIRRPGHPALAGGSGPGPAAASARARRPGRRGSGLAAPKPRRPPAWRPPASHPPLRRLAILCARHASLRRSRWPRPGLLLLQRPPAQRPSAGRPPCPRRGEHPPARAGPDWGSHPGSAGPFGRPRPPAPRRPPPAVCEPGSAWPSPPIRARSSPRPSTTRKASASRASSRLCARSLWEMASVPRRPGGNWNACAQPPAGQSGCSWVPLSVALQPPAGCSAEDESSQPLRGATAPETPDCPAKRVPRRRPAR